MSTFNRVLAASLVVQIILAAVVFCPQATPAGAGPTLGDHLARGRSRREAPPGWGNQIIIVVDRSFFLFVR